MFYDGTPFFGTIIFVGFCLVSFHCEHGIKEEEGKKVRRSVKRPFIRKIYFPKTSSVFFFIIIQAQKRVRK